MKNNILYIALIFGALMFLYPFLWMIIAITCYRKVKLVNLTVYTILISHLTVMHKCLIRFLLAEHLLNSIFVASSITIGVLIFGSMVGYALSRLEFKGRNLIFYIIIFTMTLPFQITLIPQYIIMVKFGWVDTYLALIVPYLMNALSIIMFRQYFKSIPTGLIDAARIDGCNELTIIFRILWPNSIPALVTVGIITFMASWNEVLWPLIVIRDEELNDNASISNSFCCRRKSRVTIRS